MTIIGTSLLAGLLLSPSQSAAENIVSTDQPAQGQQTLEAKAMNLLETYCVSCHGPDKQEGDTRFDALEVIDTVDLQTLFLDAQDVLHFEEMPPEDADKHPSDAEREILLEWLKQQLTGDAAKKLEEKMRRPESGNYTDHEELFSGEHADKPGFTHDRRWLISEYIFNEKFNRILGHETKRRIGDQKQKFTLHGVSDRRGGPNLTNPFLLPDDAGIRYYANESLNGGHLLTMMGNAKTAADYMLGKIESDHRYKELPMAREILSLEIKHRETLERRREFLEQHIIRLLEDIYQSKHEDMLPKFVPSEVARKSDKESGLVKRGINIRGPGKEAYGIIFRSMYRLKDKNLSKAEIYEAIEREWFNFGYQERDIAIWIKFLNDYWDKARERTVDNKNYIKRNWYEYKPLAEDEMKIITRTIHKHRKPGDRYLEIIEKCMAYWAAEFERERIAAGPPGDEQLDQLIRELVMLVLEREPRKDEFERYRKLAYPYASELGRREMIKNLIHTVMLSTDLVYRSEFGVGEPDAHDRRMLSAHDASFALSYALTDSSPDQELAKAAAEGRLNTRSDYEREVRRMLARRDQVYIIDENVDTDDNPSFTRMPIRELRFFREFFGYDKMLSIFKDADRFGARTYDARVQKSVVAEADLLVEYILESDEKVIEKLLTTDEFYVYHTGDNEQMQEATGRLKKFYNYFKDKGWRDFTIEDLRKHKEFCDEIRVSGIDTKYWAYPKHRRKPLQTFKRRMEDLEVRIGSEQKTPVPYDADVQSRYGERMRVPHIVRMFNLDMGEWNYQPEQPTRIEKRKGILTHPAWLISFAANFETDPIHRGIWIQEKLLAGTIPDVPITVDAVIPQDPQKTLHQRLDAKTNNNYCMRCHDKINPLGIPFEIYDDFGRYRTQERLEHPDNLIKTVEENKNVRIDTRDIYKTLPVDATGYLKGTGDSSLDGEVKDALDLIERLGKSDRARQSIIRYAFRYFLGRNETLRDSKTLIDADQAYLKSGGSFDEVIVSLLTSDSFIYRKPATQNQ